MKYRILFFIVSAVVFGLSITGCFEEEYYTGNDVQLRFSQDTLTFDTVFTTVGSATRILKVYNDKDKAVKISKIYIENNKQNQFRLNIDGISANEASDIEIGAGDSIYIFGEVTVNPDAPLSVSPFVIEDNIVFETNGNISKVVLQAWGQNANYITGKGKGKHFITTCDLGEIKWDDPKPYVIYGSLHIDSCTLILPAGTKVYIHGGIAKNENGYYYDGNLFFHKNGKLITQGTKDRPVIFQTDRLEHEYQDINALWFGIFFLKECSGSKLNHTVIQNATFGLYLDSLANIELNYTKIYHIGSVGIYSRHASVKAVNSLIADIGSYNVMLDYGGEMDMTFCTIYNNNKDDALVLKNYICTDNECSGIAPYKMRANFTNCIIYGTNNDEILLANGTKNDPSLFDYHFSNCLIKVKDILKPRQYPHFFEHTEDCLNGAGKNPLFADVSKYNYRPDTMAIVIDKGKILNGIRDDLDGNIRDALPDIGCYEFQK